MLQVKAVGKAMEENFGTKGRARNFCKRREALWDLGLHRSLAFGCRFSVMLEEEEMIVRCKCVIRAEVFARTNMTALLCGHVFHAECIQKWFEHTDTPSCPNCGASINTEQIVRRLFFSATDDLDDATLVDELMEKVDNLEAENNNLNRQLDEARNLQKKLTEERNSVEEQLRTSKKNEDNLEALVKSVEEVLKVLDKREADLEMLNEVCNNACTTLRSVEEQLKILRNKETD
ncbi:unnamed protein product [Cylicocyclus nassatus]|uniref:RING-type domain-containing protein n=1 Tax=Cylicocyclus nassatus TaxID=53992 RepID=A0AA36M4B4_CYLNA|nr:unnamed protein product [Cylicocyclus nassatus]